MIGYMVPYVAASTTMESKTVGGPPKAASPIVLEAAEGRPIVVDAATYGTVYPIMHGTRT